MGCLWNAIDTDLETLLVGETWSHNIGIERRNIMLGVKLRNELSSTVQWSNNIREHHSQRYDRQIYKQFWKQSTLAA
jgi:hypothetical protein